MSNPFRAIGKAFKSVVKVVKKVAVPALMIGAVVLTGGAALGVLPSLGAMVGSLGLSAGVTTALTGAISTGAVGAVAGGLTGGWKGATKGFLMGAATGGVLGAAGALGPNGLIGGGKAVAGATGGIAPTSAPLSFMSQGPIASAAGAAPGAGIGGSIAPLAGGLQNAPLSFMSTGSVAPNLSSAVGELAATQSVSSVAKLGSLGGGIAPKGIGGFLERNPMLASQMLGGVSQAFAPNEYKQRYGAEQAAAERASGFAFGGYDSNGKKPGGMIPGVYSGGISPLAPQTLQPPPSIRPENYFTPSQKRWDYDPTTSTIVERRA